MQDTGSGFDSKNEEKSVVSRRSALKTFSAGLVATTGVVTVGADEVSASSHRKHWNASASAAAPSINNYSEHVSDLKLEYIKEQSNYYDYLFTLNASIVGRQEDDHSQESHVVSDYGYKVELRTTEGAWSLGEINDTKQHYPANNGDPLPNESIIETGMDFAFDLWDNAKLNTVYTAYEIGELFTGHTNDVDKEGKIKWGRTAGAFSPFFTDVGVCHQVFVRVPKDSSKHIGIDFDNPDVHIEFWGDKRDSGSVKTKTYYDLFMDADGGDPGIKWGDGCGSC